MSPCRREHLTLPTPPPEGVALRIMKASDLPRVRALHVSTSFLHTYRLTSTPLHPAQSPPYLLSGCILRPTAYQPATALLSRDRPRRCRWLRFSSR